MLVDGEPVDVPEADSYRCELDDFAAAVAGEREPLLGRDDALAQARVIDALYRSAESGDARQSLSACSRAAWPSSSTDSPCVDEHELDRQVEQRPERLACDLGRQALREPVVGDAHAAPGAEERVADDERPVRR